jgi:hypothetical protein
MNGHYSIRHFLDDVPAPFHGRSTRQPDKVSKRIFRGKRLLQSNWLGLIRNNEAWEGLAGVDSRVGRSELSPDEIRNRFAERCGQGLRDAVDIV